MTRRDWLTQDWRGRLALSARAAALIALLALASVAPAIATVGCAASSRPALVSAVLETDGGQAPHFPADVLAGGQATVGTDGFTVQLALDPIPDREWLVAHVKTSQAYKNAALVEDGYRLDFGWASPGSVMQISLEGIALPETTGGGRRWDLAITRAPLPTVTVEVREGGPTGPWKPCIRNYLGQGPREVKITLSTGLDRACAEASLSATGAGFSWQDANTVILDIPALSEDLELPGELHDLSGLGLPRGLHLALGRPPRLWSYNPATGERKPLAWLVPDILDSSISPDGLHVLMSVYSRGEGPAPPLLIDTVTGEDVPLEGGYIGWAGNSSYVTRPTKEVFQVRDLSGQVTAEGALPKDCRLFSISPDGGKLAVYGARFDLDSGDWLVPNDLVVYDLATGAEIARENQFVEWYCSYSEGYVLGAPAWSPDGKKIAGIGDLGGSKGGVLRVFDLETGQAETVVNLQGGRLGTDWVAWSPDGQYWLSGGIVISTSAPYETSSLGLPADGRPFFSPHGRWVVRSGMLGWEDTAILDLETGESEPLDTICSFPCGWATDGLFYYAVWPLADYRYRPEF